MNNQTLELQSDSHEVWYSQGMILANLGCYEEALASVDKVLAIQPDNHTAWVFRGGVLTHLDRYKEALTSFERALKIQPDDKTACLFRGVALHHLGQDKQAYASYDRVLGIERHSVWQKGIQMLKQFLKRDRLGITVVDSKISNYTDDNLVS